MDSKSALFFLAAALAIYRLLVAVQRRFRLKTLTLWLAIASTIATLVGLATTFAGLPWQQAVFWALLSGTFGGVLLTIMTQALVTISDDIPPRA